MLMCWSDKELQCNEPFKKNHLLLLKKNPSITKSVCCKGLLLSLELAWSTMRIMAQKSKDPFVYIPPSHSEYKIANKGCSIHNISHFLGNAIVLRYGLIFDKDNYRLFVWKTSRGIKYSICYFKESNQSNSSNPYEISLLQDIFKKWGYEKIYDTLNLAGYADNTNHTRPITFLSEDDIHNAKYLFSQDDKLEHSDVVKSALVKEEQKRTNARNELTYISDIERDSIKTEICTMLERDFGRCATFYQILRKKYGFIRAPQEYVMLISDILETSKEFIKAGKFYYLRGKTIKIESKPIKKSPNNTSFTNPKPKRASLAPGEKVIVVKKDIFSCLKHNHNVESLLTDIPVLKSGRLDYITVEIQHCKTENKFFMFETDFLEKLYQRFKQINVLKTFIFNGAIWGLSYKADNNWASYSPLNLSGYNVNQQENLSEKERRQIIDDVIDLGVLTPQAVKSYLSWYISNHGRMERNHSAVMKWRADLTYVQEKYPRNHIGRWVGRIRL